MFAHPKRNRRLRSVERHRPRRIRCRRSLIVILILFPAVAFAQSGSPFDTGFTALQTLFTGTIAKVASLIAIVVGGYQFAHGEPGAKKTSARAAGGSPRRLLAGKLRERQQIETDSASRSPSQGMNRAQHSSGACRRAVLEGRSATSARGRYMP